MARGNEVVLVGNLTRDLELRFTQAARPYANGGIAVNRRWQDRTTNAWMEETSFFNFTAWGEIGENAAGSLAKGDRVVIYGDLKQRSWETEASEGRPSEKRSTVEIVVESIGPDLRFATAKVTRTNASGGNGAAGVDRVPDAIYDESQF